MSIGCQYYLQTSDVWKYAEKFKRIEKYVTVTFHSKAIQCNLLTNDVPQKAACRVSYNCVKKYKSATIITQRSDLKDLRKWQQNRAWKSTNKEGHKNYWNWWDIIFQKVLRINNYTSKINKISKQKLYFNTLCEPVCKIIFFLPLQLP